MKFEKILSFVVRAINIIAAGKDGFFYKNKSKKKRKENIFFFFGYNIIHKNMNCDHAFIFDQVITQLFEIIVVKKKLCKL